MRTTPTILTTENDALDGELADLRKQMRQLLQTAAPVTKPPIQQTPITQVSTTIEVKNSTGSFDEFVTGIEFNAAQATITLDGNLASVLFTLSALLAIGNPVGSGVAGEVLYVDVSGNLANSTRLVFNNLTISALQLTGAGDRASATVTAMATSQTTAETATATANTESARSTSGAAAAGFGTGPYVALNDNSHSAGNYVTGAWFRAEYDGTGTRLILSNNTGWATGLYTGVQDVLILDRLGNANLQIVGGGFGLKSGSNARVGTAVLAAGAVTVSNTSIDAATLVFTSIVNPGGTQGIVSENHAARVNGTSFALQSTSATDTSTVAWLLIRLV